MNYILPDFLMNTDGIGALIFEKEIDQLAMQISDYCMEKFDTNTGFTLGKDNVIITNSGVFHCRRAPNNCKDAQYFLSEVKRIGTAIGNLNSLKKAAEQQFPDGWLYITGLTNGNLFTENYRDAVLRKHSLIKINNFLRTNRLQLASLREVQTRQLLKDIKSDYTIVEPCLGLAGVWSPDDPVSKPYKSLFNK